MIDAKSKHITDDGVNITIARTIPYTGKATISRFKGSNSDYTVQNRRLINTLLASNLVTGEIVAAGSESYLTVVSKKEVVQGTDISIIAHGMLCNATLTVARDVASYDGDGNPTGSTTTTVINAATIHAVQINGKMRETDAGLLASTVMKTYSAVASGVINGDKATVAGKYYRVDDINFMEYPGCMVLQLSAWAG